MKISFLGKSGTGKSILFDLLKKGDDFRSLPQGGRLTTISLPDVRLKKLVEVLNPEKYKGVEVSLIDPGRGVQLSSSNIVDADCLILVIKDNTFEDFEGIITDILKRDIGIVAKRLHNLESELKKRHEEEELQKEYHLLQKCSSILEENKLLNKMLFSLEEEKFISGFQLLSSKNILAVFNRSSKDILSEQEDALNKYQIPYFVIDIALHLEIQQLKPEERQVYYKEYNLDEKDVENLLRFIYSESGFISFYTIAGKEIRAWPLKKGRTILEAAGKIHTDMAKGFIRSEVISFKDFTECDFSLPQAKEKGLLRLESKEYIVEDGDIVYIRFKV